MPYLTQLLESWQLRLLCKYHNWLAIVFAKVYFELHSNSLFPFIFPFFGSCTELADKYHEGDLSFKSAWSYIVVINNCSQVVCIYFWEGSNFAYYTLAWPCLAVKNWWFFCFVSVGNVLFGVVLQSSSWWAEAYKTLWKIFVYKTCGFCIFLVSDF